MSSDFEKINVESGEIGGFKSPPSHQEVSTKCRWKIDVSWIFCYLRLSDTARYCVILSAFAGYFVVRIVVRKSRPQQGFSGGSPG